MDSSLLTLETIADKNFNIIVQIFEQLNFVDQLRLAQTSPWLKQIFKAKIWTLSYKTMTVNSDEFFNVYDKFFNVYAMNGKGICLDQEEFTEFLALYANEVTELNARDNYCPDLRNFKNITRLRYKTGKDIDEHLKSVTENCPNLENLEIIIRDFRMECDFEFKFLNIDYLLKLRHLFISGYHSSILQYEEFCDIIKNSNLESFGITSLYINVPKGIHVETPKFLTALHITLPDSRLLGWNFNIFHNLLTLSLTCKEIINANDWNTLCKAANCLETITMTSLKMPEAMEFINLPNSLKHVKIESCKNLTDQHLRQILNLPNLLKFSSAGTKYKVTTKDLINYKLPPQLQSLNLGGINTVISLTSIENNQNLEELTWYKNKKNSLLHADNRLLFCKSLKTLNVERGTLASDIILRMQNLCKLSLGYTTFFKWSDVIALMKHPGLKELYIGTEPSDSSSVRELVEGFPINLKELTIDWWALKLNLSFWLDLLCQNLARLKLIVDCVKKEFLEEIVGHKNFPKRKLSTITYDDYIVDCKTLLKKFNDINSFNTSESSLSDYDSSSDLGERLVLCRDNME